MTVSLTEEQVARGPEKHQVRKYFRTASERYNIHKKRETGAAQPWTADAIFQQYRFCNLFREHDKVTIWIRRNWREPFANHPNLPFAMALARLINWPPTLEEIGFPKRWQPHKVEDLLFSRKHLGEKVYTGAYLLGAVPTGVPRQAYLVWEVLDQLKDALKAVETSVFLGDRLETAWRNFRKHKGIGDFLAYEIVSDLRHTKYLQKAKDIRTWANAGPGALRGLTRLWGYQPKTQRIDGYSFPKRHAQKAMQDLLAMHKDATRPYAFMPAWEMREVEHWLCEFDKYERIRLEQGVLEKFTPKEEEEW